MVAATSHMAVSSGPPVYPPIMGICSIMMMSPAPCHPASMFSPDMSIFSSFNWEHSWESNHFRPSSPRPEARRPVADSGVCGPYMHIPGRPALRVASRLYLTSAMVALISHGVFVDAGCPSTVFRTPLTMVSTVGSWA